VNHKNEILVYAVMYVAWLR